MIQCRKDNRRDPYAFEVVRLVVALRLLSFPVEAIAVMTGVQPRQIRIMLREHGIIPVDRAGRYRWTKGYAVPPRHRTFLQLPAHIPKRTAIASKHVANAVVAALGADSCFSLPPAVDAPAKGYVSAWGSVAAKHRETALLRARRARR